LAASAARPGNPGVIADLAIDKAIRRSFASGHALVPEKRLLAAALTAGLGSLTADDIRNRLPAHGIVFRDYDGQRFCARINRDGQAGNDGLDASQRERQEFILNRQRRAMLGQQPAYPTTQQRRAYGR
jgi:hypothetical protein